LRADGVAGAVLGVPPVVAEACFAALDVLGPAIIL
jgi:hypothetical protein